MKKLYATLLFGLTVNFTWAQSPLITTIVDGDCTGGSPKFVEIYAKGQVDFAKYALEKQSNDNTEWSNLQDLSALGELTDTFAYIVKESDVDLFKAEFPSAASATILTSSVVDNNGDDRIRLIESASGTVIDQYGETDKDGTGETWEYTDSYAKRNSGTTANGGTFTTEDWTIGAAKALDGKGLCQSSDSFETVMSGIGDYNATLNLNDLNSGNFSIYPNPVTNGRVRISSKNNGALNIHIYDILGKQVLQKTLQKQELNVSNLKSGLYVIKITQNNFSSTKKLIIK
ncbi:T9SS type A sorting domain-containing protein [Formosa sp. S-31]|uniref:T9SS type A sorting domain-containing protein n=1 Tax=Formosa sp. S-31 TaxID=2790949 RepID=UPI003EB7FA6A